MSAPRIRSRGLLATAALTVVLASGPARASARDVATRVEEQWKVAGARTTAVPSRFVFDDETILVPIPAEADDANPPARDRRSGEEVGRRGRVGLDVDIDADRRRRR